LTPTSARTVPWISLIGHAAGGGAVQIPANARSFDEVFIVTERAELDLARLLREGRLRRGSAAPALSPQLIRRLSFQLLDGLEYIHAASVYHRECELPLC
jgi:serine/threonine protein kinase